MLVHYGKSAVSLVCKGYKNNYVKRNICDLVTPPKEQQREMRVFTLEEQQALQDALKGERLGIGVLLSLYTGMRIGEILGLKFSDIDFKECTITVRRSLNRLEMSIKELYSKLDDTEIKAIDEWKNIIYQITDKEKDFLYLQGFKDCIKLLQLIKLI